MRKSDRVRVHHEKKSDGVRFYHEKKSDKEELAIREKERWGESSL